MDSIANGSVSIQSSWESVPSTPSWFGEVALMATYLRHHGILTKISEQVRFARRRFGHYEVIDFVAVLLGYAISGERTLEAFYERLQPFAVAFMALFERDRLPSRSALSRFLAALTPEAVEALRALFLNDLLERRADFEQQPCGLTDRTGKLWKVFDIDGTREAARQRALPKAAEFPLPQRRLDEVCAPGYTGRKRGEIVRTRTTVVQAHSYQWLGTFGNRGNGEYRKELRRAVKTIQSYAASPIVWKIHVLCCGSMVSMEPERFCPICSGYPLFCAVKSMACLISQLCRPACTCQPISSSPYRKVPWSARSMTALMWKSGPNGQHYRLVVATHLKGPKKQKIGVERDGLIYELFLTKLPQEAFTASDVVAAYLHRGSFETVHAA